MTATLGRIALLIAVALAGLTACAREHPGAESLDRVMTRWEADIDPAFDRAVQMEERAFSIAWELERDQWLLRLSRAELTETETEQDRSLQAARITYVWGAGRLAYPERHAAAVGTDAFEVSQAYNAAIKELAAARPDLATLKEYNRFREAYAAYASKHGL